MAARGLEFQRTVGVQHGVRKRRGLNVIFRPPTGFSRDARVRSRRDAGLSCRWLLARQLKLVVCTAAPAPRLRAGRTPQPSVHEGRATPPTAARSRRSSTSFRRSVGGDSPLLRKKRPYDALRAECNCDDRCSCLSSVRKKLATVESATRRRWRRYCCRNRFQLILWCFLRYQLRFG